jgi:hypothetical protein
MIRFALTVFAVASLLTASLPAFSMKKQIGKFEFSCQCNCARNNNTGKFRMDQGRTFGSNEACFSHDNKSCKYQTSKGKSVSGTLQQCGNAP